MKELLDSKWFYWLMTGIVAAMWAALVYFFKRQRDADDARFKGIEKRQEEDRARMNRLLTELPITYTLRDEFLRVSTQQNGKLDKIADMISDVRTDIAGMMGREQKN